MDLHDDDSFPHGTDDPAHALGIVTAIVVVAGFTMVAAWFALLLMDERQPPPASPPISRATGSGCNICGVVERVSEIPPQPPQALEGSRAEGAVILLATLGGAQARQVRIYETSVLHDDGSVRVLRDPGAPRWALGDRVKVVKGRVEPASAPGERTQNPIPPVARAP